MNEVAVETLSDWQGYVLSLSREELSAKCRGANSMQFVKAMRSEGYSLTFIESVLKLFVRRMVELEVRLPEGGAFDLREIQKTDILSGF
jgi:hypothetical protein